MCVPNLLVSCVRWLLVKKPGEFVLWQSNIYLALARYKVTTFLPDGRARVNDDGVMN